VGAVSLPEDADVLIHEATFFPPGLKTCFRALALLNDGGTSGCPAQEAADYDSFQLPCHAPGNDLELKDLLQEVPFSPIQKWLMIS